MSDFQQVANIKVGDNIYNIKDNIDRNRYNNESQKTVNSDNILLNNKRILAEAITNKGVTTSSDDSLLKFAENISNIKLGLEPAKGILELVTCNTYRVSASVAYNYPKVSRLGGGEYNTNISTGSGGYKYELQNGNENKSDAIIITRVKVEKIPSDVIIVAFFNTLIPVCIDFGGYEYKNNEIACKINGGSDFKIKIPISETLTMSDFYIKTEVSSTSDTQVSVKIYTSGVNADEKPLDWIYLHEAFVNITDKSSDLYLSVLGVDIEWYTKGMIRRDKVSSTDADYGNILYSSYIDETCIALKDTDGIYKVVLGASSLYPYKED